MSRDRILFLLCALAGALPASAAPDGEAAALDEIIVSARKRDETAQSVPISLSIASGADLEARNANRIQDMLQLMPNVLTDVANPRIASISIRGLGKNTPNEGLESSVGVFVDGVYLGRSGMVVSDFIDVERVEVLRGPQGTLFGKNSTAGAINIVTRMPASEREGWLEVTGGDYSLWQAKGSLSLPIDDELTLGINGSVAKRDGFTTNITTGSDTTTLARSGVRANLVWRPREQWQLRLIADYNSQDEASPGYLLVDPAIYLLDGGVRPDNIVARAARSGYAPKFDPLARESEQDAPQRMVAEQAGISLQAELPVGAMQLTSISAWRKWNFRPQNDGDLMALDVQPQAAVGVRDSQLSQELRLASATDGPLDYLLGLYWFDQKIMSDAVAIFGADAAAFLRAGLPPYALDGFQSVIRTDPHTTSYAAFGQVSWEAREGVELTAGARWTTEGREASIERTNSGGVALAAGDTSAMTVRSTFGAPALLEAETREDFVSGLLSASWQATPHAMLYLSASRGAKSGGINTSILPAGVPLEIEPEVATGYEVGLKGLWLDRRVQMTASAFTTNVQDFQATVREPLSAAAYLTNAGDVRTRGAELEASLRLARSLTLNVAAGWNDARYTSFANAPCPPESGGAGGCDFTGKRVVGASPVTASMTADYHLAFGSGRQEFFAAADYQYVRGYQAELPQATYIDSYDVVNSRIGLRARDDNWAITFWVRNLFDSDYFTTLSSGGPFNVGVVYGLLGAPRTLGITARKRL